MAAAVGPSRAVAGKAADGGNVSFVIRCRLHRGA